MLNRFYALSRGTELELTYQAKHNPHWKVRTIQEKEESKERRSKQDNISLEYLESIINRTRMLLSQTVASSEATQARHTQLSELNELYKNLLRARCLLQSLGEQSHLKYHSFEWRKRGPAWQLNSFLVGLIEDDLVSNLREQRKLLSDLREKHYALSLVPSKQLSSLVLSIK